MFPERCQMFPECSRWSPELEDGGIAAQNGKANWADVEMPQLKPDKMQILIEQVASAANMFRTRKQKQMRKTKSANFFSPEVAASSVTRAQKWLKPQRPWMAAARRAAVVVAIGNRCGDDRLRERVPTFGAFVPLRQSLGSSSSPVARP
eukprot:802688-Prorocentrum_minimum.AAC.2